MTGPETTEPAAGDRPAADRPADDDFPGAGDRPDVEEVEFPAGDTDEDRARKGERVEMGASACFLVAMVAAVGLAVVYWQGGQTQLEGALLAVVSGGIGVGIVLWAKHFMPGEEVSEDREALPSTEADREAFTRDFEAGESTLRSRRLLLTSAIGAATAFGAALLFPIRSLGPRPGGGLKRTAYARGGVRVVQADGTPVKADQLPDDSVVTVWPEGHTEDADAPTLLIRTRNEQEFKPRKGRDDWTVEGIVAYSKLCTHVGCPVGLYQAEEGLLLCPCHQSTFDVLDGARPIFGPAARSLPQLPLDVDGDGYIVARGDFSSPTGPGFWDRGR
jgi:ubiquinol-cytochrome c reductase iron-sulfur subunit